MNNTTRRHQRTLQEAFGPYCDDRIEEDAARYERRAHAAMYVLVAVFFAVSVAFYLTGA
jgi:hypothetical protein